MMLGLRESFEYFECGACGCLQIADFPADMDRYYPRDYYSLRRARSITRVRKELGLLSAALGVTRLAGALRVRPRIAAPDFVPAALPKTTRVLDVGAGNGVFAGWIYRAGYHQLHAMDPNLDPANERSFPYRLERVTLDELVARGERYGFVYLSHSLEHMPDQRGALDQIRNLLAPGGVCCVRIPWISSEAWEKYGANWVQLDAPRHFYLHSRKSFELLASASGFRIAKLWCDSTGFQFWGSEQYAKDIPLLGLAKPRSGVFTGAELDAFERRARELNERERGDQITAWLEPS
jgi:SAM-dependent methyltransferase